MKVFEKSYLQNPLKKALQKGEIQIGFGLNSGSATIVEIVAGSGFDFLWIDSEHGHFGIESILAQARAIAPYKSHCVVRPLFSDRALIKQLLDAGIQSIIAPMIKSKEQAKYVVASMYYPPKGKRGFGAPAARAGRWARIPDYAKEAQNELCLMLQIESKLGLQNLKEIVQTEEFDAIFLVPADLAVDMGYFGDFSGKEMQNTIEKAIKDIRKFGKAVGTITTSFEEARRFIDWGASFVVVGGDVVSLAFVADSAYENFKTLKK